MSLQYEPASEPLQISVERNDDLLHRVPDPTTQRVVPTNKFSHCLLFFFITLKPRVE